MIYYIAQIIIGFICIETFIETIYSKIKKRIVRIDASADTFIITVSIILSFYAQSHGKYFIAQMIVVSFLVLIRNLICKQYSLIVAYGLSIIIWFICILCFL